MNLKQWQELQKSLGNCIKCGNKAMRSLTSKTGFKLRCKEHLKESNESHREYRERWAKEKQRILIRRRTHSSLSVKPWKTLTGRMKKLRYDNNRV
jgi:hypothetical protein